MYICVYIYIYTYVYAYNAYIYIYVCIHIIVCLGVRGICCSCGDHALFALSVFVRSFDDRDLPLLPSASHRLV